MVAAAVAVVAATGLSVHEIHKHRQDEQIDARLEQLQADPIIPALDRVLGPHKTLHRYKVCRFEDAPYVEIHYTVANTESVREKILRTVRAAGWHADGWIGVGNDYYAVDIDRQLKGWHSSQSFLNVHTGDLLVNLETIDHSGCL
ncbi:hypothetical protein [Actinacidiphila acididurans]|uniref:Uncharacterized protein n=1 Tax=Actinacidiphila acididurans TaxID=2784346 RepID=A0ABS2TUP2_9ACTN|nr:hypothetical protein [Actinacidiphila acididurans]MBM9506802.1 hypothetical protein [Actinacidiphila acididurans]